MTAVVLALLSSLSFAASHVVSKRGIHETSVSAGFIVTVGSAWVVVMTPLLIDPPADVSMRAVGLFALSGLFAPAISRAAALAGVRLLGPSIAVPIQQGLRPLLAVPAAAVLLAETVGALRVAGLAAIVGGGWMLSRDPERIGAGLDEVAALDPGTDGPRVRVAAGTAVRTRLGLRRGIALPVLAAVGYASADLLVKAGLDGASDPVYAAPISIGTGLLVWALPHVAPGVRRRFHVGPGLGWLVLSGALMGAAILLLFHALARGDVSLVAPVIGTQPLFVLGLSAMILRHIERRERTTVVAALMIVAGTILVSLGR